MATRCGKRINGWLVIDKPFDITSSTVVSQVRRFFDAAKVGHAGTLDPLASGILPLAFGEATKTVSYAMNFSKSYRVSLKFGEARITDDAEGKVIEKSNHIPSESEINEILGEFIGEIQQVPPKFSAIKVNGKRAYNRGYDEIAKKVESHIVKHGHITNKEAYDRGYTSTLLDTTTFSRCIISKLTIEIGKKKLPALGKAGRKPGPFYLSKAT